MTTRLSNGETLRHRLEREFNVRTIPVFQRATEDGQGIDLWVANSDDYKKLDDQVWIICLGSWPGFSVRIAGRYWEPWTRKGYVAYGQWIEG